MKRSKPSTVVGGGNRSLFFVFALVSVLGYGFLEASAKAKIANFATNLAALAVFAAACVLTGDVAWPGTAAGWSDGSREGSRSCASRG